MWKHQLQLWLEEWFTVGRRSFYSQVRASVELVSLMKILTEVFNSVLSCFSQDSVCCRMTPDPAIGEIDIQTIEEIKSWWKYCGPTKWSYKPTQLRSLFRDVTTSIFSSLNLIKGTMCYLSVRRSVDGYSIKQGLTPPPTNRKQDQRSVKSAELVPLSE